jgi:pilus assembly protein CpaE
MRVVIATDSAGQQHELRLLALAVGLECKAEDCVGFNDMSVRVAQGADLVLVAVGSDVDAAEAAIRYAVGHGAAPVVGVGLADDPQLVIRALRAGAREYVPLGRFRDEMPQILERLRTAGGVVHQPGKTIAVLAANAGSGVTTVAAGLAFALAAKHPGEVALAELGADVPELALDLDLEPRHSVADVIQDWERMDPTVLSQAMVEHPAGVRILAYAPEAPAAVAVPPAAMQQTVLLLRHLYEFSVLDLGHAVSETSLTALRLADTVVAVLRLDVPSLRLSRQLLRQLAERGIPESKVRAVANRYGQRHQVSAKQIEEAVGAPIRLWVPDDPGTLNQALNHGKPLIQTARHARITRRLDQLAQQVNGRA